MITWLYKVDEHCNAYRVPIDLDTLAVDWLHVEPWQEPPLVSRVRTRTIASGVIDANADMKE